MGTLSGNAINATYDKLLKFSSQNIATSASSFNSIEDGAGSATSLELTNQATGKVRVRTKLAIGSSLDPTFLLDIGTRASALRVSEGGHTSLLVGNNNAYGFAAGDVNVAPGVGTGGSAQVYSNYIAIDPTAHSGKGQAILMNGDAAGAIGIGNGAPLSGEIEIGANTPLHKIKFNVKNTTQALNIYGNSETLLSIDGNNKRIGIGENVIAPTTTLEVAETGTATSNQDIITITNKANAASMIDTRTGIQWNQFYYDGSSPAVAKAANIHVGTETNWTSTTSTQDSYMSFLTKDGSVSSNPAERVRITSAGRVGVGTTSPSQRLHVVGNIKCTGTIYHDGLHQMRPISRYTLSEQFKRAPGLNADIQNASEGTRMVTNPDFEVGGTNAVSGSAALYAGGGISLTTAGSSDTDSVVILPHKDSNQSSWETTQWSTAKSIQWGCRIRTGSSLANCWIKAGLTADAFTAGGISLNNDECYFLYTASDVGNTAYLPVFNVLYFVYSIGGVDFVTNTQLALSHDTAYDLSIHIDENRQPTISVNGVQYGLANTAATGVARDYGATGCLVNHPSAGTYSTTGDSTTIAVDGNSASTLFKPNDYLMDNSGNIYGRVTSVPSSTSITLSSINTAMPNNADIYLQSAVAVNDTDAGDALTSLTTLKPKIAIGIDDQSTTTARHMYVYDQTISRII